MQGVGRWGKGPLGLGGNCCLSLGAESSAFRVDTNCQRNAVTAPVTLVLGLGGHSWPQRIAFLKSAPNAVFRAMAPEGRANVHALREERHSNPVAPFATG